MWSVVTGRRAVGNGSQVSGPAPPPRPAPWEAPVSPRLPSSLAKPVSVHTTSPSAPCALDPCSQPRLKPWLSCGFQLFEAAVVASSKSGCGSAADETQGVIYSRVALGPGARPGPGESQGLLIRDQREEMDGVLDLRVPRVGRFGTDWFGACKPNTALSPPTALA